MTTAPHVIPGETHEAELDGTNDAVECADLDGKVAVAAVWHGCGSISALCGEHVALTLRGLRHAARHSLTTTCKACGTSGIDPHAWIIRAI